MVILRNPRNFRDFKFSAEFTQRYQCARTVSKILGGVLGLAGLYSAVMMALSKGPVSAFFLLCGAMAAFMFANRPSLFKLLAILAFLLAAIGATPPIDLRRYLSGW